MTSLDSNLERRERRGNAEVSIAEGTVAMPMGAATVAQRSGGAPPSDGLGVAMRASDLELKPSTGAGALTVDVRAMPMTGPTRVPRSIYMFAAATIAIAATWAFWPITSDPPPPSNAAPSPMPIGADSLALPGSHPASLPRPPSSLASSLSPSPLDLDAFRVPIWVTPPAPPPPASAVAAAPPPPLRLQLLAITREDQHGGGPPILRATLYDPDTDRLVIVAGGEKIGERTVERLTPGEIEIVGADGRRVLALADTGTRSGNGGRP